jgi:putative ABC transport system ATP-binding protein
MHAMTIPILRIRGLSKSYGSAGRRQVFRGVDLDVGRGEYVAIMGESGIGKSTLLNLIAGLDTPDAGSIAIDGAEFTALDDTARTLLRRSSMGFVFQAFHLLPHLSIAQNVALPLVLNGVDAMETQRRIARLLDAVGLASRAGSFPRELSGGEMQRIAVARALSHRPRLLLADEPTGNLDPDSAAQVLRLLREQVAAEAGAGILVTHSATAAASADRVYVLGADGLRPREAS